jgi:hypothetical protein
MSCITQARGSEVVKALCYKPEGRGFQTRSGERIFSIYLILLDALGPGVYSASNRNKYQKQKINDSGGAECGWCVGLTNSPPSVYCLDNVGSLTSHNPIGLHGPLRG